MSVGGGAATNSGIDYQQRIAAFILAQMLSESSSYSAIGLSEGILVDEVRFETNNKIDDLVLITDNGRVLIQAKRTLNLSESIESEYSSVLKQFIGQYINDNQTTDLFVLATSSRSSQRITKDLRKLTEAIRLNERGADENPLTEAERDVLKKTHDLMNHHYQSETRSPISDNDFKSILKRIRVSLIDIEEGAPLEGAILTLLAERADVSARLLWMSLISLSLSLAKDRLSIGRSALFERMGSYIPPKVGNAQHATDNILQPVTHGKFSAAREILLVSKLPSAPGYDYCVLECKRFDESGNRRFRFCNGKVKIGGQAVEIIGRWASYSGMERFFKEHEGKFSHKKVALVPLNTDEDIENEPHARLHAEHCQQLFHSSVDILACIRCGDAISEDRAPSIEIDEEGHKHAVGLVHKKCLRATDRVLGEIQSELFQKNPALHKFDYKCWFKGIQRGQGLFHSMASSGGSVYRIGWRPDHDTVTKGGWCVKINLNDGGSRYACQRGQVVRLSEKEAIAWAEKLSTSYDAGRKNNDPWCYTSPSELYSTYSGAIKFVTADETFLLCNNAEPVRFTQSISETYSTCSNYYAPLVVLLEEETGRPVCIEGAIFLVTNPLKIQNYLDNWHRAGVKSPGHFMSIIETDEQFDKLASNTYASNNTLLIDPTFDMSGVLSSGFVVENFYDIITSDPLAEMA